MNLNTSFNKFDQLSQTFRLRLKFKIFSSVQILASLYAQSLPTNGIHDFRNYVIYRHNFVALYKRYTAANT